MPENVIMPKLGMAMKEGKVAKWQCEEGERVEEGDVLVVIETDKVNYEVEAPISGILVRILVGEGQTAPVGQIIGILITEGEAFDEQTIPPPPPEVQITEEPVPAAEKTTQAPALPGIEQRVRITPIARQIATEKGIDVSRIKGSGPDGRITKKDVLAAAEPLQDERVRASGIVLGAAVPLTRMRQIIGERLTGSSRDVPHIYLCCEVDGTGIIQFRETCMEVIEKQTGVRLSFNDIMLKCVATMIEKYPLFNATLNEKTIRIHPEVNIGLAVALEEGLVVPVIRRVNEKELGQIATERREIIEKANRKKLTLDDLSGGTFTVSNLGGFNIDLFTSIINPPETAILSVAKMKERPVAIEGKLAIRPTVNIGLSADHRVVDGATAARFLQDLQGLLEDPSVMSHV